MELVANEDYLTLNKASRIFKSATRHPEFTLDDLRGEIARVGAKTVTYDSRVYISVESLVKIAYELGRAGI